MSERITVHRDGKDIYDIVVEQSFGRLAGELETFSLQNRRVCIVTDSHVAPLYLKEVEGLVKSVCRQTESFIFPAGEASKNLDTVKALYEFLILHQFDRQDMLLALGGGVVGDLCGFTAATYLRGIDFIQIPTTLLSQVDSSIGGKTGVDFDAYKNMVGAFYMPRLVYANIQSLNTLGEAEFSSGMGEVIKHGLIKSREYYDWLDARADEIRRGDADCREEMIRRSMEIKRAVVEQDPTEQGERALLNFGHTLGHAIEKLSDFRLMHGHCVGLGCIAAVHISAERGLVSHEETDRLIHLMERYHMPVTAEGLEPDEVVRTTKNDKKMDSGVIKFILLQSIGEAYVDRRVTAKEMAAGLSRILR